MSLLEQLREIITLPLAEFLVKFDAIHRGLSKKTIIKNVNSRNSYGMPLIHVAIATGDAERVKKLMDNGAAKRPYQVQSALHFASTWINVTPDVFEILLSAGANPNRNSTKYGPCFVLHRNNPAVLNVLFKHGLDVSLFPDNTPGISDALNAQRSYVANLAADQNDNDDSVRRPKL